MHIAGVGDCKLAGVAALMDPCPLPSATKKKGLREKEKLLYAPMSDVGEMLYDKDAVYININDHQVQFSKKESDEGDDEAGEKSTCSVASTSYREHTLLGSFSLKSFSYLALQIAS